MASTSWPYNTYHVNTLVVMVKYIEYGFDLENWTDLSERRDLPDRRGHALHRRGGGRGCGPGEGLGAQQLHVPLPRAVEGVLLHWGERTVVIVVEEAATPDLKFLLQIRLEV